MGQTLLAFICLLLFTRFDSLSQSDFSHAKTGSKPHDGRVTLLAPPRLDDALHGGDLNCLQAVETFAPLHYHANVTCVNKVSD